VIGQDMSRDDAADLPFLNVKNGLALDTVTITLALTLTLRCRNSGSAVRCISDVYSVLQKWLISLK